jgi:ABC-2 type transport system permease protein
MRPIVYEIRRTLTSKFVIIMIIAIVGLSSLLAYEAGSTYSPSPVSSAPQLTTGYYMSGSSVVMVGYAHDAYGNPVSGIKVSYDYNGTTYNSTSASNGFANYTIPAGNVSSGTVHVSYTYTTLRKSIEVHSTPVSFSSSPGSSGLYVTAGIVNPSNSTMFGLELFYVGTNGTASPSLDVYGLYVTAGIVNPSNSTMFGLELFYVGTNGTTSPSLDVYVYNYSLPVSDISTNYSYKHSFSGFTVLNIFPTVTGANRTDLYKVEVTNSSGYTMYPPHSSQSPVFPLTDYTPMTQSTLQSLVYAGTSEILGFLIPILAVFAAYLTYGKDRTNGVLESVLKRPVTRGGLITSRFLSNSVSIVVAVGLSMIFSDLIIHHYFGMYLSTTFSLYFVWTYVVEGISFLALVYMFSHIAKSQGAVLGAAIALFVVLDLFWSIIPIAILAALKISTSSTAYVSASVGFDYASPAGYSTLVQTMFTGKFGIISSSTIDPSAFGITAPFLIVAGILWMAVPFVISYYLAKNRD